MLLYLYADELEAYPKLKETMFRDRAVQFSERLNWEVTVDENGFERDSYDDQNPLYAVWRQSDGTHGGSLRIMPTTAPCMVNDHFSDVAGGSITSPLIWECTRFCLSPNIGNETARLSAALMLAVCEIGLHFHLSHIVGVFDPRMIRIYRTLGWSPEVIGTSGLGRDKVQVGLWEATEATRKVLCAKTGVSPAFSTLWVERSFGDRTIEHAKTA
jgi:acyl homoserine lactone synthase